MQRKPLPPRLVRAIRAVLCAFPVLLVACGGGGGGGYGNNPPPLTCDVPDQKVWLGNYMQDWYFWYAISPNPNPDAYATVAAYFDALLFGGNATFPSDRYSYFQSTTEFNRFYGDGKTLGYGVSVAGLEVAGQPARPLLVRYVEPASSAATAGVARGDQVVSANGRSAADMITANDFSALTPAAAGNTLTLVLRNAGVDRTVTLTATVHDLTPVRHASVHTTAAGRKVGYIFVKDMVSQTATPLQTAFAQFKTDGVQELVLDMRYNGGGLVSVANNLASYVTGATRAGQPFAQLLYNDRQVANNQTFNFTNPVSALGLSRVYVLMGRRTCSASEQVINGLRGVGVNVVAVGETSCGKPVGFLPQDDGCGTTYSVVNFESVNARNEGRYFDGFQATCVLADNLSKPLGAVDEALLGVAKSHADNGVCPPGTAAALGTRERPLAARPGVVRGSGGGEGVPGVMLPR